MGRSHCLIFTPAAKNLRPVVCDMNLSRSHLPLYALIGIGLISCSMLIYEILLTRICALRLFFHFGYLVISNCLLGIGASGSMIAVFQDAWRPRARFWITVFSGLYLLSLVFTYVFVLTYQIPPALDLSDGGHLTRFFVFTLVTATPFFFAGSVIGMILTFHVEHVYRVYGVDLLGAGLGCLLTPLLLAGFGAGGTMIVAGLLALATLLLAGADVPARRLLLPAGAALACAGIFLLPGLDARLPVPGKGYLDLTSDVAIRLARFPEWSRWSSNSRIDLLRVPDKDRFIHAQGTNANDGALPQEHLILQDGWAGTFILNFSQHPEGLSVIGNSLYSAALGLKAHPRVLVVGMGGGNDVWAAWLRDPEHVKAIELNRQILEIHRSVLPQYSRALVDDPRIEMVHGEGRSELMRDDQRYDVVQMTGIDTWTALTSGAYVLAENYLYTREALQAMYARLADEGILNIIRFSADVEMLRLLSNINAAFTAMDIDNFARSVVVLRTADGLAATLVKRGVFTPQEREWIERFTHEAGIEIVYLPGRGGDSVVSKFVRSDDKSRMIREFPRDISATTDDRPYFFNYYKWRDPLATLDKIQEPSQVAQGNPAFILGQLALAMVLSFVLILLPLVLARRRSLDRRHSGRFGIYFVGLGLGFIMLEIALMQKLVLFLGHPMYSITVTLFALLVFTGLGSLVSKQFFPAINAHPWGVPLLLGLYVGAFLISSSWIVETFIGLPLAGRVAVTLMLLLPIGFVLGVPFAYGIRCVNRYDPTLVPWAWAVNGFCTVIGSILAVIVSMNLGFSTVMLFAVAAYCVAFGAIRPLHAT